MASTALLLHDVYRELCASSERTSNTESTRAMVLLVQAVIQCWENCPDYSRAMKEAQTDCEFVTATIDWLSERDRTAFQSLTYINLDAHIALLRQHGVTDDDLLTLNALAKSGDPEAVFQQVSMILQKLQQPTLLIALGLVTMSRVPATIAREVAIPKRLPPLSIGYINNGQFDIVELRNPHLGPPLTYAQRIYKGQVVISAHGQFFALGEVSDSSDFLVFNGVELINGESIVPPPYDNVIGLLYFRDWILIDLDSGNVRVFHPMDQSFLDARLDDFCAEAGASLHDGQIVLTLASGESRVLQLLDIPTLDLEEQAKEQDFIAFLRRESQDFVVATNTLACL